MSNETTKPDEIIGSMPMPVSFTLRDLFLAGRPRHQKYDDFWRRHPPMDLIHRAKIFAPFDALAGFDECIRSKKVVYSEKKVLSEGELDELNEKLSLLHSLTCNSRVSEINRPGASVEYFVPCGDPQNEWYGKGGHYETVTGTVRKVDAVVRRVLLIDDKAIPFSDISAISLQHGSAE